MSEKNRSRRAERVAAAMEQSRRRAQRRRVVLTGAVVLAMIGVIAAGFLVSRARDTTRDVAAIAAGSSGYGVTIGDPKAPRQVVIYEDFLCPYCGDLEAATRDGLAQLADDGKVYVEYRPFVLLGKLGDYSARSTNAFAVVLKQSGPAVAKSFHDMLFENQPSESGPFPDNNELVSLAVRAGAQESKVRDGIMTGREAGWGTGATRSALDAGVQGTPTVLLDGQVFQDGRTLDEMSANLLARLR